MVVHNIKKDILTAFIVLYFSKINFSDKEIFSIHTYIHTFTIFLYNNLHLQLPTGGIAVINKYISSIRLLW